MSAPKKTITRFNVTAIDNNSIRHNLGLFTEAEILRGRHQTEARQRKLGHVYFVVGKPRKGNGLLSNLRTIKAHDKRAIQGAGLKGRLEAIDAQIRDVTVDPFYKREKGLQGLALRRLKERRREIQGQIKKNPVAMTENQAAWRKGYEHGYKGLNSRPDYPKVGLAGSYRLGYEAGEKRRRGKAQPRKNVERQYIGDYYPFPMAPGFKMYFEGNSYSCPQLHIYGERSQRTLENAIRKVYKAKLAKLRRTPNPKREAKTSKDAFGVTHENPSDKLYVVHVFNPILNSHSKHGSYDSLEDAKARAQSEIRNARKGVRGEVRNNNTWKVVYSVEANPTRKNPSVTAIAEKFQGGVGGAIEEFHASSSAPANLARAGKLVFLKVGAKTFRLPGAMVAIAPNEKLWIVSKRAPVFSTKAKPGEGLDVGEVNQICYETAKAHIGEGKRFEYVHEFGEDGGKRPHLIIDHEGMPILRGGDYKIKAEGIVN